MSAQIHEEQFKNDFERQFHADAALGKRVLKILDGYFRETTSPGLLVYEEALVADKPLDRTARQQVNEEIERARKIMLGLLRTNG